jgi:hypothetical protein
LPQCEFPPFSVHRPEYAKIKKSRLAKRAGKTFQGSQISGEYADHFKSNFASAFVVTGTFV